MVQELNGDTFDLGSQHGKVVVVNFWATWCPPCRKEMPVLDTFYRKHHPQGIEVVGVSIDRPRDAAEVHSVMQSFSYPAAMLNDAKVNEFGTPDALPETFVVDSKGIVRAKLTPEQSPVTENNLAGLVLPLLDRKSVTQPLSGLSNSRTQGNRRT